MALQTRIKLGLSAVLALGLFAGLAALYDSRGWYGFHAALRRGGVSWVTVDAESRCISPAMRLALSDADIEAVPGPFTWHQAAPGFEAAELPVLSGGAEVDRILLARVDPERYRFVVRNAPAGDQDLQKWMRELGAALVINGSYYAVDGTPETPLISDGKALGPPNYAAHGGAFVANTDGTNIRDLGHQDWRAVLTGAEDALVSYPLLVGGEPDEHEIKPTPWLANRSFVGEDAAGHIILGTTKDGFFSLARLAAFLHAAPLGLTLALNLDGGPVACQAITVGDFRRNFCGRWETQVRGGKLQVLTWPYGTWALPIVLAAIPK